MDRNDPLYPKRWILYWHGSGVPWPDKAQPDGLHNAAEIMVREHNLVVDRLRAVLKLDEIAVQ